MDRAEGSRAWSILRIVPFAAKRSVVKLDNKESRKKRERWQADRQGGCGTIGERYCATSAGCDELSGSDELAKELDVVLVPYELQEGMKATEADHRELNRDSLSVSLSDRKAGLTRAKSSRRKRPAINHTWKTYFKNRDSRTYNIVNSDVSFRRTVGR